MRTNIEFNRKNPEANTISIVSGGPGEGKSTTLANLAFISAQGGYSTLIVDADLRRPVQHRHFRNREQDWPDELSHDRDAARGSDRPDLGRESSLLPSGMLPSDAVGILNSQRMSDMIAELKTRYDIVFFDSPPMLGVSDASVLASEVDQTIIVVQHRRFPRAMLTRVKQAILGVGGTRARRRAEQRRSQARSELLLLHQLLRLLSAARQESAKRSRRKSRGAHRQQRRFRTGRILDAHPAIAFCASSVPRSVAFGSDAVLRVGDPIEMQNRRRPDRGTDAGQQHLHGGFERHDQSALHQQGPGRGAHPAQLAGCDREALHTARQDFHESNDHHHDAADSAFRERGRRGSLADARSFTEDMTLLAAINAAGGFNDFADQKRVRLLRGSEAKVYDVRQFRKDPSKDVNLQPGDRIEVPQSFF